MPISQAEANNFLAVVFGQVGGGLGSFLQVGGRNFFFLVAGKNLAAQNNFRAVLEEVGTFGRVENFLQEKNHGADGSRAESFIAELNDCADIKIFQQ